MTEIQYIPKDWDKKIEAHLDAMQAASSNATAHPPGPEFEKLWDSYEAVCHDFLDHLSTHYGSAQGFSDTLHSRLTNLFDSLGLETNDINEYPNWKFSPSSSVIEAAEQASRLYRINYVESTEAAAHHRAFHHQSLDLTL